MAGKYAVRRRNASPAHGGSSAVARAVDLRGNPSELGFPTRDGDNVASTSVEGVWTRSTSEARAPPAAAPPMAAARARQRSASTAASAYSARNAAPCSSSAEAPRGIAFAQPDGHEHVAGRVAGARAAARTAATCARGGAPRADQGTGRVAWPPSTPRWRGGRADAASISASSAWRLETRRRAPRIRRHIRLDADIGAVAVAGESFVDGRRRG